MFRRSHFFMLLGILSAASLRAQDYVSLAAFSPDSTRPTSALVSPLVPQLHTELVSDSMPGTLQKNSFNAAGNFMQSPPAPPIVSKPLSLKAVLIPTAMIAFGAYSLRNEELRDVNLAFRKGLWEGRHNGLGRKLPIDNFSLAAPAVAVYALNMAGIKGKSNFVDRTLMLTMSSLIGNGIVSSVKNLSGVIRPDSSNKLSFPSGHTAQAFIAAEFMRQEYKHLSPWYGIAGYTVAAGTGFLRMYNNKHWFNDVIAGAGVGILSTRLSYWLYPKMKNLFVKDGKEKKSNTVIMPTYQNGAVGFGMVHSF